jgi:deoxyribodipyrimidine photolyase
LGQGGSCANRLRQLNRQFISDRTLLPENPFGNWNESLLVDEDLTNDISLYLMEIGKEISASKLMAFINREDIQLKHGIEKTISECTARRYLNRLGY